MKSWFRRFAKAVISFFLLSLLAAALFAAFAYPREHRRFDLPFPTVRSAPDSALILRGEYLVNGPGHCADCHAPPSAKEDVSRGEIVPLSGGHHLDIFLGRMHFPNITPDSARGIGLRSDGELARFFRRGIDHRGEIGLPFMMYADLSDRDLASILSYLRSLPPVGHAVPRSSYNLLGKITRAYFLEPFAPSRDVSVEIRPGRTVEYGEYLVNAVSSCASCHTARNMKTGDFTGPRFGGGMVFRRAGTPEVLVSPNLTPDPETGIMAAWDEAAFIRRFQAGSMREWSPMPWGPFSRIQEDDLAAMFLYLRSLAPARQPQSVD
jgi:mono/diheme cytochrome c family protein